MTPSPVTSATRLSDLGEFRRLSAALSYMLTAATGSAQRLLDMILGDRRLPPADEEELLELIDYVMSAWTGLRRRLGPPAALHPLRAAALMIKALPEVRKIDVAVVLLHDKLEDINPEMRSGADWAGLEERFARLRSRFCPAGEGLDQHLRALSRFDRQESYCAYLGRLIEAGLAHPEITRAKLADRLDNTLDFSIEFRDPLDNVDFFEQVFECLFVRGWTAPFTGGARGAASPMDLTWRLYSLYKNVVLLSLLRKARAAQGDEATATLMAGVIDASHKEARRISVELITGHAGIVTGGRDLLRDVMDYCRSGAAFRVTSSRSAQSLDGLLVDTFDTPIPEVRLERLKTFAGDVTTLFKGAVTFLAIFSAFKTDETYFVEGIAPDGVHPVERRPV
jgi:hypothetical protein